MQRERYRVVGSGYQQALHASRQGLDCDTVWHEECSRRPSAGPEPALRNRVLQSRTALAPCCEYRERIHACDVGEADTGPCCCIPCEWAVFKELGREIAKRGMTGILGRLRCSSCLFHPSFRENVKQLSHSPQNK